MKLSHILMSIVATAAFRDEGGGGQVGVTRQLRAARPMMLNLLEGAPSPHKVHASSAPLAATQYFGAVKVGKPAQEFRVVFDTGSGQLLLPTSKCDDEACKTHRRFAAEKSSSVQQIGWADDPLKLVEDGGDRDTKGFSLLGSDVSGEFLRDSICVGDGRKNHCGTADFVGLAEEADDPFKDLEFDGVVGLSLTSPDAQEFNVLEAILGQEAVDKRVFSLYLEPARAGVITGGEFVFGGYSEARAASKFTWAPLSADGSWHITVTDITVGGRRTGVCGKDGCQAFVDTGASLLLAPGNILSQLTPLLGIDDRCSEDPPAIGFLVQGQELQLQGEDYIERSDAEHCDLLFSMAMDAGEGPSLVLGYPFLRKFYTVFDAHKKRIGFAAPAHGKVDETKTDIAMVHLTGVRS